MMIPYSTFSPSLLSQQPGDSDYATQSFKSALHPRNPASPTASHYMAYPVRFDDSYGCDLFQGSSTNGTIRNCDSAEYMLRRKTPNGTFAAGYDGRFLNLSINPPSHKHILLPLPESCQQDNSEVPGQARWRHEAFDDKEYTLDRIYGVSTKKSHNIDREESTDIIKLAEQNTFQHQYQFFPGPKLPDQKVESYEYNNNERASYKLAKNRSYPGHQITCPSHKFNHTDPLSAYNTPAFQPQYSCGNLSYTNKYDWLSSFKFLRNSDWREAMDVPKLYNSQSLVPGARAFMPYSSISLECLTPRYDNYSSKELNNFRLQEQVFSWAKKTYFDLMMLLNHSQEEEKCVNYVPNNRSHPKWQTNSELHQQKSLSQDFLKLHNSLVTQQIKSGIYDTGSAPLLSRNTLNITNTNINTEKNSFGNTENFDQNTSVYNMLLLMQPSQPIFPHLQGAIEGRAREAMKILYDYCVDTGCYWIDGMLLGGCLAYALKEYHKALDWFSKITTLNPNHVEAISNTAASLLCLNERKKAEQYWLKSIDIKPEYFSAVEHLIGLLCFENRREEALLIIEIIERSIKPKRPEENLYQMTETSNVAHNMTETPLASINSIESDFDDNDIRCKLYLQRDCGRDNWPSPGYASHRCSTSNLENIQILSLAYIKGNILYALGEIDGTVRAFENAVLISTDNKFNDIRELINKVLSCFSFEENSLFRSNLRSPETTMLTPFLLPPEKALETARLVFLENGCLPSLLDSPEECVKREAVSITSNSLLSLAKIFQDSMSDRQLRQKLSNVAIELEGILALYYLSLSLQPSPSTANNIGILLADVQQSSLCQSNTNQKSDSINLNIPGVIHGNVIAYAIAYYYYGLDLDPKNAHIYTNLGSLLRDIGQLTGAVHMYEKAVACDGSFDIALVNLANAVKDQGRTKVAINYFQRAVTSSPNFADAVCGLANCRNSICDWVGRGGAWLDNGKQDKWHVDEFGMIIESKTKSSSGGWMKHVIDIVTKQLMDGSLWGIGMLQDYTIDKFLQQLEAADSGDLWSPKKKSKFYEKMVKWSGKSWEGARIIRLIERALKRGTYRWYVDKHIANRQLRSIYYPRPQIPSILVVPSAPTVLPFHTFTYPVSAKDIRLISQLNALRISYSTLKTPWMQGNVFPPPNPPAPCLNVGYVSSDFNDHPLAHLMQSVFGMHDISRVKAFCFATTPSDNSIYRQKIEREAPIFRDLSSWPVDQIVEQIIKDNIHILINLNGYTRGARNEIFAARPTPIQMSFMGFNGTLGAQWCDYLLADETTIPNNTLRPWRRNLNLEDQILSEDSDVDENWIYSENIIFCRDTFFCCDHAQSCIQEKQCTWEEEQAKRWKMRKELFPTLSDQNVILGNFNQLYKIEPTIFRTWLRILDKVPRAILWLLRFPDLGEDNLKTTARNWAGESVARRIWFSDVAPKSEHISRARVCDLFLDTPECNAHTTAADILWSCTPILTLPRYKYKMCSRIAASIIKSALPKCEEGSKAAKELIANDECEYETLAITLASQFKYRATSSGFSEGVGRLNKIRKLLFDNRWTCALFDTKRWVSDLETAYEEAWRRWEADRGGDIYLKHLIK